MMQLLTTIDNPFNPFTNFDEWFAWDTEKGYGTTNYLGRIAITSEEISEAENDLAISNAMKEIVENDATGLYILVSQ